MAEAWVGADVELGDVRWNSGDGAARGGGKW
jgi:hypothetical protein